MGSSQLSGLGNLRQGSVTKVEQVPSTEPGIYRFKAHLGMQGRWRLSLAAKVEGETGTVEDKLIVRAAK